MRFISISSASEDPLSLLHVNCIMNYHWYDREWPEMINVDTLASDFECEAVAAMFFMRRIIFFPSVYWSGWTLGIYCRIFTLSLCLLQNRKVSFLKELMLYSTCRNPVSPWMFLHISALLWARGLPFSSEFGSTNPSGMLLVLKNLCCRVPWKSFYSR